LSSPIEKNSPATATGWQQQLREAIRDVGELERMLELPAGSLGTGGRTPFGFPMLVPRSFIDRMRKGDALDPLLRQVLPVEAERTATPGFGGDPLTEQQIAHNGTISKYPGRALLITTGACPVHCRYCFRREFPYAQQTASRVDWQPALEGIRSAPGVREIVLSGGDPLSLSNDRLRRLIAHIESIPKISTVRIHTRFPIVLPARIDEELTEILAATRLNTVVVVHANHPAEIDNSVAAAARELKNCTGYLLNQSVLLRGINDNAEILIRLSERLQECGITPYYLHMLDRVAGSAHFEVDEATAISLVADMRRQVSGYLVPTLVRDRAGELSKTPII
jgi:EF-P beta-lysylation protein EpmB